MTASAWAAILEPAVGLAAAGIAYLRKASRSTGKLEQILQQLTDIAADHENRLRQLEARH